VRVNITLVHRRVVTCMTLSRELVTSQIESPILSVRPRRYTLVHGTTLYVTLCLTVGTCLFRTIMCVRIGQFSFHMYFV
jgi:hypothetical protein